MSKVNVTRRELLAASVAYTLPLVLQSRGVAAAPDPTMTIVKPPGEIVWSKSPDYPDKSVERASLWSDISKGGLYYTLVKWYPGYMSAPHWYEEDRYCVVLSGTWWVASGAKFDPMDTVPVSSGSFIRRVARTPHYDGVKADGKEPAVIAICGMGPIAFHNAEPNTPNWRKV